MSRKSITIRTLLFVTSVTCFSIAIFVLLNRIAFQSREIARLQNAIDQQKCLQIHYGEWLHLRRPKKFLAIRLDDDGDDSVATAEYVWIESPDPRRFDAINSEAIEKAVADLKKDVTTSKDRHSTTLQTSLGAIEIGHGQCDEGDAGDVVLPWEIRWSSNGFHRGFLYSPWYSANNDLLEISPDQSDSHRWPTSPPDRWSDFSSITSAMAVPL